MIILLWTCLFASCREESCTCPQEPELVAYNDSIINTLELSEDNSLLDYWKRYGLGTIKEGGLESYRWSYQNYISHYMKIYILDKQGEAISLRIIERIIPTTVGFETDSLIRDTIVNLAETDWKKFEQGIEEACYWTTKTDCEGQFLDGEPILIEGFKPNGNQCTNRNYHLVLRIRGYDDDVATIFRRINELEELEFREF